MKYKLKWSNDEYRCECENDYMCNSITCDNECNKVCKIQEYLDIKNCSGKERLILN